MNEKSEFRVILIDDEESALDILEILLKQIGNVEIAGRYVNPQEALEEIRRDIPDAVFLDIEMPGMNGIELAEQILDINETVEVIFITAYNEYAVKAFEIHSLDYILKPVLKERLKKTMDRLIRIKSQHQQEEKKEQFLSIKCFGNFEVSINEKKKESLKWKTSKVKEVCAYLVHNKGNHVERDSIIEAVWPNTDYEKAKINLYTTISYLRKTFLAAGYNNIIEQNQNGYKMNLKEVFLDTNEFEKLFNRKETISAQNIDRYEQLEKIYQGDYLDKSDYSWADYRREDLRNDYVLILNRISRYYIETGDLGKAEDSLKKIMKYQPYSEESCRNLMKLYLETGNRVEAIRLYEHFKETLKKEIGLEPQLETVKLFKQINNGIGFAVND